MLTQSKGRSSKIQLRKTLIALASPQFESVLKHELEALAVDQLPLQQGLKVGSHVLDDGHSIMILSVTDSEDAIYAKVGVMYHGIIAGCSCADDPTPVEPVNEYCELVVMLDKHTGLAKISLVE